MVVNGILLASSPCDVCGHPVMFVFLDQFLVHDFLPVVTAQSVMADAIEHTWC